MKALRSLAALALGLLTPVAASAQLPWVYCANLPGCRPGYANHLIPLFILTVNRLQVYGYMLGVLFVMIGGGTIVLSLGNEERMNTGRNTVLWALVGIFVVRVAVKIVEFVTLEAAEVPGGDVVVAVAATLVTTILDLLTVGLLCVAVFSGMRMIAARGKEDEYKTAGYSLLYAIIGAIIIQLAQRLVDAIATLDFAGFT